MKVEGSYQSSPEVRAEEAVRSLTALGRVIKGREVFTQSEAKMFARGLVSLEIDYLSAELAMGNPEFDSISLGKELVRLAALKTEIGHGNFANSGARIARKASSLGQADGVLANKLLLLARMLPR